MKLTDCAFVANKCERVVPDEKTATKFGLRPPLTAGAPGGPTPPTKVAAAAEQPDAVRVTWAGGAEGAVGFRVERQTAGGKWKVIAYRPPCLQTDPANPQTWVDFTAPPGKDLMYRVVALGTDDTDKGASEPTAAVALPGAGK
ncbi:MAG: hypothetical protein JWO38_7154 [Gemmataceae bacterium]|nr:hypothetical protein [Gemmataceae bacterium]